MSREKHAPHALPAGAAHEVLRLAGFEASDLDAVAYSWSAKEWKRRSAPFVVRNFGRNGRRALREVLRRGRRIRERRAKLRSALDAIGVPSTVRVEFVEHHEAHVASGFHAGPFEEAAIASIDGTSDLVTMMFARGTTRTDGRHAVELRHEVERPDSLGLFYSAITDYLGFDVNDGEFKVMGMAAYGDPERADLSDAIELRGADLHVNPSWVAVSRRDRYQNRAFGPSLVERFGPPRVGDASDEPYIHIAAAAQAKFEAIATALVEKHLAADLDETGRLVVVGGCALNVAWNGRLLESGVCRELFVPPAPSDPGTAVGAALVASERHGVPARPLSLAYLGTRSDDVEIARAIEARGLAAERVPDIAAQAAERLAAGRTVAWFQGRMEWGPRALGARSILGHPGRSGTADRINAQIKFRERWRPFCPAILASRAAEIFGRPVNSPFMNVAHTVVPEWRERIAETVHVDGTSRPQLVDDIANPRFQQLITEFESRTGLPAVLNTSLNRRGEPICRTPDDALDLFEATDLDAICLGDWIIERAARTSVD